MAGTIAGETKREGQRKAKMTHISRNQKNGENIHDVSNGIMCGYLLTFKRATS
jgi:hypothetical protein